MIAVSSEVACDAMQFVRWITRPRASAPRDTLQRHREFVEYEEATSAPMSALPRPDFVGDSTTARSQRTMTL